MKKSYLMIAAAAALFAACQDTDTIKDVNKEVEIGFSSQYAEKATRAEINATWLTDRASEFGVYGYKEGTTTVNLFNNEKVYYPQSGDLIWKHDVVRFWDKGATDAYDFYAYAPYDAGSGDPTTYTHSFNKAANGFTFTAIPVINDVTEFGADKAIGILENKDYDDFKEHLHPANTGSAFVNFTLSHILSKLSFKIKTSVPANSATLTVKKIEINFPSSTTGVTWTQSNISAVTGTTTYSNDYAKPAITAQNAFGITVYEDATGIPATASAQELGNKYIVTPVGGTVTRHIFDVRVTYDILYLDNNTTEAGCVATGTIGNGTPATNLYQPAQNQHFVAVIDLNPEKIEFCVESVDTWNPVTESTPVEVK